jgi:hypothetical protein
MKDIAKLRDEELINLIDDGDNQDIFDEIRRRLKKDENMKCCGNCKKYTENRNCYNMRPGSYCRDWFPDGLTREGRQ